MGAAHLLKDTGPVQFITAAMLSSKSKKLKQGLVRPADGTVLNSNGVRLKRQ